MSIVTCDITMSLDGYVAGPEQSFEDPIGKGGARLHEWIFDPQGEDQAVMDAWQANAGDYIMGETCSAPAGGVGPGLGGGTTFHFVTDGVHVAIERPRAAAADSDVLIAGGASTVNAYLAAGLIDELRLHIAPVLLGAGARLFDGVAELSLEQGRVIGSPGVTHIDYRPTVVLSRGVRSQRAIGPIAESARHPGQGGPQPGGGT